MLNPSLAAPGSSRSSQVALLLTLVAGALLGAGVGAGRWDYTPLIIVVAMLVLWPVHVTLGLYAMLVPFDQITALGPSRTGTTLNWFVGLAASLVIIFVGLASRRVIRFNKAALWWTCFLLWGVLTMGWAVDMKASWERLPTALALWALYLVATAVQLTERELLTVSALTVVGGVVAAALACFDYHQGATFHGTVRSSLMFGGRETDPNFFSASLLMPLSLAIGAVLRSKSLAARVASLVAVLTIALGVLFTMSRGGLVATLVIACVYLYKMRINPRLLLVVGIIALTMTVLPDQFYARLSSADRGAGRIDIWTAGLSALPNYILQGAGWNNFPAVYHEVAGRAPVFHGLAMGAHNIYLSTAVELGILGLAFMLLACRAQLREAKDRWLLPYEAGCWGMLASGMFLDVIWRKSFWLSWILLAIAVRVRQHAMLRASS